MLRNPSKPGGLRLQQTSTSSSLKSDAKFHDTFSRTVSIPQAHISNLRSGASSRPKSVIEPPTFASRPVSYSFNSWLRLRNICKALRQTEENVAHLKQDIEEKLSSTEKLRKKKSDVQSSQINVESLYSQLEWRKARVRTLSAKVSRTRNWIGVAETSLAEFQDKVTNLQSDSASGQRNYMTAREKAMRTSGQLIMRRRQVIDELCFIYPVSHHVFPVVPGASAVPTISVCQSKEKACNNAFQIANVHLPDAENYAGHDDICLAVALGYVTHVILILSRVCDIPLRYSVIYYGSRSAIEDHIALKLGVPDRVFPLFPKGQDRMHFQYAVYLLNKNIAQLMCYYGIPVRDLRCTLENLHSIFEFIHNAKISSLIPRPISNLSKSSSSSLTILDKSNVSGTPEKAGGVLTAVKVVKSLSLPHSEIVRSSSELVPQQPENVLLASIATTGIGSMETVSSSPSTVGIDAIVGRARAGSDITVETEK